MAERLKPGFCGICNTTQIWFKDNKNKRIIFTNKYAEFAFVLSDDKLYRHAVCKRCIVNLTEEKVEAVLERIKETWLDEMVGWGSDKQFKKIRNLTIETYDLDQKKAFEKYKIIKEEKFKEKLEKAKQVKKVKSR